MDNGAIIYGKYLNGDDAALTELVVRYSDGLTRFAYSIVRDSSVAEDIMEDTFAALIVKKKKFAGEIGFKTYLYTIARNKCYDWIRFHRRFVPLCDVENVLSYDNVENDVIKCERYEMLYMAIGKLPAQYRDALSLTYFEDFSITDTAKIMHKTVKQVYNILARAKQTLKTLLSNEGD